MRRREEGRRQRESERGGGRGSHVRLAVVGLFYHLHKISEGRWGLGPLLGYEDEHFYRLSKVE